MFTSNHHISDAVSDSDGLLASGPSMVQLFDHFESWVRDAELSQQQQDYLFFQTALNFYRL